MDPEFLDLADVLLIHEEQLARYGGSAGLRDQGLLESAIAMPQATFGGAPLPILCPSRVASCHSCATRSDSPNRQARVITPSCR